MKLRSMTLHFCTMRLDQIFLLRGNVISEFTASCYLITKHTLSPPFASPYGRVSFLSSRLVYVPVLLQLILTPRDRVRERDLYTLLSTSGTPRTMWGGLLRSELSHDFRM